MSKIVSIAHWEPERRALASIELQPPKQHSIGHLIGALVGVLGAIILLKLEGSL